MNATQELFQLADTAAGILACLHEQGIREPLRVLRQERTRAGLAAARQRGRAGGRPKLLTTEKLEAAMKLLANGTPPRDVADILGVSAAAFET